MLIFFSILGGCTLVFAVLIMAAPEVDLTTNRIVRRHPADLRRDHPTALLSGN